MRHPNQNPFRDRPSWLDAAESPEHTRPAFRGRRALRLASNSDEAEGEVDRSSSAYVSWLQSALNRIANARLTVDGDFGNHTLSAVVAFQRNQGLSADGAVGPLTEAALIRAGAGTPPGTTALPSTAPGTVGAPTPGSGSSTSGKLKDNPKYTSAPLAPRMPITISSAWPKARRDVATTFNRVGGLIQTLATDLGVDVPSVLAVWSVESGPYVHVQGQAVIRFETHKFFEHWGKSNTSTFDGYFKFGSRSGSGQAWENQQFRTSSSGPWISLHTGSQANEYAALKQAIQLGGDPPAIKSISIGGCQILGSNHALIGYATPRAMYDAFQGSERWHVLGFFDFCRASNILSHLTSKRWSDFASVYNGSGQAATYGGWIAAAYAEAAKLSFPAAPSLPNAVPNSAPNSGPYAGAPSGGAPAGGSPVVNVNSGVVVSANAIRILQDVLRAAGLRSATITSGRRDATNQARVMYDLIERNGVSYAKNLYGSYGDQVIDVYAAGKAARQSPDTIKSSMRSKIIALGPTNVSLHCSETRDIIDVAPSSIANADAFRRALDAALAAGTISRYIPPPTDPAFHIEIPLATSETELAWLANAPMLSSHVLQQEAEESLQRETALLQEAEAETEFERARPRRRPRPGHPPRSPMRKRHWLGNTPGLGATLQSAGPDCGLANARVAHLGELLSHLAKTDGTRASELSEAVRLDVEGLIKLVPFFVSNGCTRCHLTHIAKDVDGFAWPESGALRTAKDRVLELLDAAQRRALDTGKCG